MMNANSDNSDIDELDSNGLGDASASHPTVSSVGIEVELDQKELSRVGSSGDTVAEVDEDTRQSEQQLEVERKKISKARRSLHPLRPGYQTLAERGPGRIQQAREALSQSRVLAAPNVSATIMHSPVIPREVPTNVVGAHDMGEEERVGSSTNNDEQLLVQKTDADDQNGDTQTITRLLADVTLVNASDNSAAALNDDSRTDSNEDVLRSPQNNDEDEGIGRRDLFGNNEGGLAMNNTPQTSDESVGDQSNNAPAKQGGNTPFGTRNLGINHVQISPEMEESRNQQLLSTPGGSATFPNRSVYTTTPTTQTNNERRPPNTGTSVNISPEGANLFRIGEEESPAAEKSSSENSSSTDPQESSSTTVGSSSSTITSTPLHAIRGLFSRKSTPSSTPPQTPLSPVEQHTVIKQLQESMDGINSTMSFEEMKAQLAKLNSVVNLLATRVYDPEDISTLMMTVVMRLGNLDGEKAKEDISSMQEEMSGMRQQISSLQQQLRDEVDRSTQQQQQIDANTWQIGVHTEQIQSNTEQIQSITTQIDDLAGLVEGVETEMLQKCNGMEDGLKKVLLEVSSSGLSSVKESIDTLKNIVNSQDEDTEDNARKLRELQAEVECISKDVSSLQENADEAKFFMDSIHNQQEDLQRQVNSMDVVLARTGEELRSLQADVRRLQVGMTTLKEVLQELPDKSIEIRFSDKNVSNRLKEIVKSIHQKVKASNNDCKITQENISLVLDDVGTTAFLKEFNNKHTIIKKSKTTKQDDNNGKLTEKELQRAIHKAKLDSSFNYDKIVHHSFDANIIIIASVLGIAPMKISTMLLTDRSEIEINNYKRDAKFTDLVPKSTELKKNTDEGKATLICAILKEQEIQDCVFRLQVNLPDDERREYLSKEVITALKKEMEGKGWSLEKKRYPAAERLIKKYRAKFG